MVELETSMLLGEALMVDMVDLKEETASGTAAARAAATAAATEAATEAATVAATVEVTVEVTAAAMVTEMEMVETLHPRIPGKKSQFYHQAQLNC